MEFKELIKLKKELFSTKTNLLGFYIAPTEFKFCSDFLQDYWKTYGPFDFKDSLINDKFLQENLNYLNQDLSIYAWTIESQKAFEEGSNHIIDLPSFKRL